MGVVLMSSLMVLTFVLYSLFAHLSLFFCNYSQSLFTHASGGLGL